MSDTNKKPIDEVLDTLKYGVQTIFNSQEYKEMLRTTSKFHSYSLNNCILIATQCPGASYVAGYKTWQGLGHTVNKGEKAIRILAPCPKKVECEQKRVDPNTGKVELDSDGKEIVDKVVKQITSYKVAYVFDISQTSGEPLPTITHTLSGNVENFDAYKTALEKVAPCPVVYKNIDGNANGYYDLDNKVIAIQDGLSQEQTVKTLIHEITHATIHNKETGVEKNVSRLTMEVEAESVAYVVCEHLGIDSSQYSFGYVAGWSSSRDAAELEDSLNVIHDTSSELIQQIDVELQTQNITVDANEKIPQNTEPQKAMHM